MTPASLSGLPAPAYGGDDLATAGPAGIVTWSRNGPLKSLGAAEPIGRCRFGEGVLEDASTEVLDVDVDHGRPRFALHTGPQSAAMEWAAWRGRPQSQQRGCRRTVDNHSALMSTFGPSCLERALASLLLNASRLSGCTIENAELSAGWWTGLDASRGCRAAASLFTGQCRRLFRRDCRLP
jgi:hypothetical protein